MKIDNKIVKNYAYSLYQLACEKKNQIKVLRDLQLFHNILKQNTSLMEAMTSPLMAVETKLRIIKAINQKVQLAELVINLLTVMAKNNRIMWLEVVISAFEKYYKTSQNISTAHIESANQLTKPEQEIIKDYLEGQFGAKFDLKTKVNHKLIGGVKINYDSNLIDLSVLGVLEKINKKLQQV
jgi:F-type H+-transporting ATPase subunit delta